MRTSTQAQPNLHKVLAAIRELEKNPEVQAYLRLQESLENSYNSTMILEQIKAALGTDEEGSNLVEVARAAHREEQAFAAIKRYIDSGDFKKAKKQLSIP